MRNYEERVHPTHNVWARSWTHGQICPWPLEFPRCLLPKKRVSQHFSLDLFDSPCPPCSNPIMSSCVESLYLALPNFDVSGAAHRCEKMDREHWLSSREQERHLRENLAHKDSCDWLSLDLGLILPEKLPGNVEHILQDLQDMCPNTY